MFLWFWKVALFGFIPRKSACCFGIADYKGLFPEITNARILHIKEERNDRIWLCSDRGLFLMNEKGQILNRFGRSGSGRLTLPDEDIRYILPNPDGTYWLATGNQGLIRFTPDGEHPVLKQFTRADGLSSNAVHAVIPDRQGILWLSSDYGIMKVDPTTSTVKTFLQGLTNVECNRLAAVKRTSGEIYFGSINGVTAFHPEDFLGQFDLPDPMMVVTRFEQFDGEKSQLIDRTAELDQTGMIHLEPDDRFFRLEFGLLDLPINGNQQFAYKLEGLEDAWQYGRERTLRFGRPPFGSYNLRIRGQDEAGNWSSHELNLEVHVHKPFWLTTWFLLTFGMILIGSLFANLRWRTMALRNRQFYLENQIEERTSTIRKQNIRLEEQAEKLQHLDEVKSKLFANVSHELRTPLTLIMGPISSVLKSGDLTGRHDALLRNAQRGGKKLLGLINEILDLSKMESGLMTIQESPVHIHSLIRRFVSQFESMARMQSIHLVFESALDDQLVVMADADKLEKVVNNYLSNAFKHTPPEGNVSLRLEEEDARLRIVVTDTGDGIHAEDLAYVFDRFYQSNQPDAAIQGGTGIGLALVKEYALLLGGDAWVESKKGQGARFFFTFPKKESFDPAGQENEDLSEVGGEPFYTAVDHQSNKSRPLILIVEDNPGLCDYLQLILHEEYRLLTAMNGQEALEIIADQTPQLILSDIMMPIMDGYQLVEQLKSSDSWRGIPLIMLTARADIRDKLKALRIGVDDYLIKPFDEGELLARIHNLLTRVAKRQEELKPALTGSEAEVTPTSPPISGEDMEWLAFLEEQVMGHLSEDDLTADRLSREVALSRRQLFRRIKELTGMTPNEYINEVRFREARRHLEERTFNTVKAVAHAIGFRDVPYFSRQFKQRFGKRPSEYLQD